MLGGRQSGRTSRQILEAPHGAVFIACSEGALSYTRKLTLKLNRADLEVVSPAWILSDAWRGRRLVGLALDHAAMLSASQSETLNTLIAIAAVDR